MRRPRFYTMTDSELDLLAGRWSRPFWLWPAVLSFGTATLLTQSLICLALFRAGQTPVVSAVLCYLAVVALVLGVAMRARANRDAAAIKAQGRAIRRQRGEQEPW